METHSMRAVYRGNRVDCTPIRKELARQGFNAMTIQSDGEYVVQVRSDEYARAYIVVWGDQEQPA